VVIKVLVVLTKLLVSVTVIALTFESNKVAGYIGEYLCMCWLQE